MTPLKDYKYFDQDITVYNGDKPLENEDNYSIKYRRVKAAVKEFEKALLHNNDDILLEYYKEVFGNFEK